MNRSESITKIAPALVEAQRHIGAAQKDADNPFFKSRYADLGSVMAVCKSPLLASGISVLQSIDTDDQGLLLETILLHESGEFIASRMRIDPPQRMVTPKPNEPSFTPYLTPDPQAVGSAISYARRHALQALVFIPSVDDDAEWAREVLSHRPKGPPRPLRSVEEIETLIAGYRAEAQNQSTGPDRLGQLSDLIANLNVEWQNATDFAALQKESSITNKTDETIPQSPDQRETPDAAVSNLRSPPEPSPSSGPVQPESNVVVPDALERPPVWQNYRLKFVRNPSYKGKTLGSLSVAEVEILWEKKGKPNLESPDPALRLEAEMLMKAAEAKL